MNPNIPSSALGTIGGGNHFAELQAVERVEDEELFKAISLQKECLYICVHSGSRGLGQELIKNHVAKHGYGLTKIEDAQEYLQKHDELIKWADLSRFLIADRFATAIRSSATMTISNNCHNSIIGFGGKYVHRKGAADSSFSDPLHLPVMIPGSRGAFSYLVQPIGDHEGNLKSIAHGAGRKWARSDCRERLSDKFDVESMEQTELGSRVICEDRELIYEEAPQAYKKIEVVIGDLVAVGLIKVIAVFRPLITYKVRKYGEENDRKEREISRRDEKLASDKE